MKPQILLIYTGGTIGMIKDPLTASLQAFDFASLLEKIPELNLLDCTIDTVSFETPNRFVQYKSFSLDFRYCYNYRSKL